MDKHGRPRPSDQKTFAYSHASSARTCRGITLLEMLFCASALALIAVSTAGVLGNGRVMRERAKHRGELALTAQSEMDRLRSLPIDQLTEGEKTVSGGEHPPSISLRDTIVKRNDGFLELQVRAEWEFPGGRLNVALHSIHPGGRQ